ncbi:DUF305 domain-containing protein [Sporichthya polymorpha]|uniref:DUF305 domain-containing protein n=1 Tax=Sporichthya polymorpha TaxID=35751 RepID=UPI00036BBE07|nr:DUF305 domain-containing protein [Sporichthya polymorpha]
MTYHLTLAVGAGALLLAAVAVTAPQTDSTTNTAGQSLTATAAPGTGPGMMMGPGGMTAGHMHVQSERDYLAEMIPHHEEAVAAALELHRSTRPELRALGSAIVQTQSVEIERMRAWLREWYPGAAMAGPYRPMMRDLSALSGDALDRAFLADMIPHHMHAVMSSQMLVGQGLAGHDEARDFAEQVATAQRDEILQMQRWLREWFDGRA